MKILTCLILSLIINQTWCQLQQFKNEFGKIGFKNAQEEVVVPCQFDAVLYSGKQKLTESNFIVKADGKYGLLSANGTFLLPLEYDDVYVSNQSIGYFGFSQQGKHGIVDSKSGQILLKPTYDIKIIFEMNEPYAEVELDEKVGVINARMEVFIPLIHDDYFRNNSGLFCLKKNGYFGFYDFKGTLIIPFDYQEVGYVSKKTNRMPLKRNGKWGAVDFTGKTIINFEYDTFGGFSSGLAVVSKNDRYGYVDLNGKVVIPLQFDDADYFENKVAFVGKIQSNETMRYGLINKKGKMITDFKYDSFLESFYDGFSLVQKAGKWGVVNEKGVEIIPVQYDEEEIDTEFYAEVQTYIKITHNNLVQVYNTQGTPQLESGFEAVESLEMDSNLRLVQVYKNGLTGLVELGTKKVVIPCIYTEIQLYDFEYGHFVRVVKDENIGVWDLNLRKLVVPAIFDFVREQDIYVQSKKQFFEVEKNGKRGIWNATDIRLIVPLEFETVRFFDEARSKSQFFFTGESGQRWGLYDQSGKCIIPFDKQVFEISFVHTEKSMFYFILKDTASQKMGVYNSNGTLVLPFIYDEVNGIKDGKAAVQLNGESKQVPLLRN